MPIVISLLRGVNVGGHHKIRMNALGPLYESLGLRDPQTYLQSGNVLFATGERGLAQLAKRIEQGIEAAFGFHSDVMLRTASEMRDVKARNPFAARRGLEPGKLAVLFLARDPGPEAQDRVRRIKSDPEEMRMDGRHLYIYFPNGMGRSKLSAAAIEKMLATPATARNWNTVTRLVEIAEGMKRA